MSEQTIYIVICAIGFMFITGCFSVGLYISWTASSARIAFLQSPAYDQYLRNQVEALFTPAPASPADPRVQRTDRA